MHVARAHTNLASTGLTNRDYELAERHLEAGIATIDHHVSAILRKLDASTRTKAVAEAGRLGIFKR